MTHKLDVMFWGEEFCDFKRSDQYGALSECFFFCGRKIRLEISFQIPFSKPFLEKLRHTKIFKNE